VKNHTKRWILAIVLSLAFLIIVPIGVYSSSVPRITIPFIQLHEADYWSTEPNVNVTLNFLFTAQGSLSVNNPVTVYVTITDANVSNLLQYYGWIALTGAYDPSTVGNSKQAPNIAFIPITASSTPNEYTASGKIVWLEEGSTWPYLIPAYGGRIIVTQPAVEVGTPVATIESVSDTLSVQMSIREEQLSWVLVGIGILAFQPIIATFILKDNPQFPQPPPTPPTIPPQSQDRGLRRREHNKTKSERRRERMEKLRRMKSSNQIDEK
jgi:hypothetical protein